MLRMLRISQCIVIKIARYRSRSYGHYELSCLPNVPSISAIRFLVDPDGCPTHPAHPARFSPDDTFSKERYLIKSRFNLLPTQGPPPKY